MRHFIKKIFVKPFGQQIVPGILVLSLALLSGCGGGNSSRDAGAPTSSNTVTEIVGSSGGSISLPDKTIVTIDPGVLKEGTTVTITTTPAPASSSSEIQPISPLITVEIPPGSLLQSSASGLEGISVEIPLNEGQINKTSAVKAAPAIISKPYRYLKATIKSGKDQIIQGVRYGKLAADATVAKAKLTYSTISNSIKAFSEVPIDGTKLTVGFNAENLRPDIVSTAGILFKVKGMGNFENSLTLPKPVVKGRKLPLILVHGVGLGCEENDRKYEKTWEKFIEFFFSTKKPHGLREKYELFSFSYQTYLPIKENGRLLANTLRDVFGELPSIVVAHSMGGLVARSAIVQHVIIGANIGGLITLATPHHGIRIIGSVGAEVGDSVHKVESLSCFFTTGSKVTEDLVWDNFDSPNGPYIPCKNPFLCDPDRGLNQMDKHQPANYEKYIPYAGVSTLIPFVEISPTCRLSNLITPTPFSRCKDDAQVPVASARFMDFNMDFDTDVYLDKLPWSGKPRTYPDIGHIEIHDDPGVLDQIAEDLLVFYSANPNTPPIISPPPTATITSPAEGDSFFVGDDIQFRGATNANGGVSYHWDFGDGQGIISTQQLTSHSYSFPDQYTVSLTVTNSSGVTGNTSITITVRPADTLPPSPPPIPGNLIANALSSSQILLSWDALPGNTGVTGYKVYRNGIFITNVNSSFNTLLHNDTSGLLPSMTYCYTVSAVNAAGLEGPPSAPKCATTMAETLPPTASIPSPANGASFFVGDVIQFQGSAGGVAYFWTFGDGGTSSQQITNYSYSFPGTYTVSLTVTDVSGGQASALISITVVPVVNEAILTVTKNGTGTGTVTSIPSGINCGANCFTFPSGTLVTLTPSATPGSTFSGWSGACVGAGTCTLTLNGNHSVTATFELSGGGGEIPRNIPSQLVGTWKSFMAGIGCQATFSPLDPFFTILSEIRSDGTITGRTIFFSDESCTTLTGRVEILESSFVIGNEITTINGFIASEFDWAITKAISIIDGVEQVYFSGLTPTIYSIIRIEGDTMHGGSVADCGCLSPEDRATELDFSQPSIRQ